MIGLDFLSVLIIDREPDHVFPGFLRNASPCLPRQSIPGGGIDFLQLFRGDFPHTPLELKNAVFHGNFPVSAGIEFNILRACLKSQECQECGNQVFHFASFNMRVLSCDAS